MKKEYQQNFETYHFFENNIETTIVGLKKFISTNNEDAIVLDTNILVSNTKNLELEKHRACFASIKTN